MKKLINQPYLLKALFLVASALLMPMGAWGQTLVFGEWTETTETFVEKSAETVNWTERRYQLPGLFIKNGSDYEESYADSYTSSNESVATVEDGVVTFVAYSGTVTITATNTNAAAGAAGGPNSTLTATFTITINDNRAELSSMGVRFPESAVTATYGRSFSSPVVDLGQFRELVLTYSSSNTNVATVNENSGVVTIVGVGETTISGAYAGDDDVKPGSVSYTLTVNPQTVKVEGITASDKTYDGTTTATLNYGSATVRDDNGAPVSGVTVSSATGAFANVNVGTGKTVTISGITLNNANYTVASAGTQTSTTANITAKEATLSWSNLTFTYDGQTHVPTATVSNLVGQDACTVTVTGGASAVGTHTATATALSNSNYALPATATTSFTISSASMEGVYATGFTGTYDGTAHGITVTAPEGATVTYGESADACTAVASPTLTNVGEKTVYYKVSKTGYTDVTGSQTVKITAKEATLSWSNLTFIYDGQTHVPTATVSNLVGQDACTVTVTGGASAVGTHTATATALSNSNYALPATATTSFTISAASMEGVSATGFTGTYDGTAHGISVTAPEGATVTYGESADACTAAASPTLTDVGEKTVYYKVSKTGYTDVTGSQTVKITAKEATLSWSNLTFTYDGQTHVPTATVSNLVGQDACTVTVTGSQTNAGSYTATATALSNSNYKLSSAATQSFTIAKAAATLTFSASSATAKMKESFTLPSLTTAPADLPVTYSSSNTNVATVNATSGAVTLVAAGTTEITATFAGNNNYTAASAKYTLTVNKADAVAVELSFASTQVAVKYGHEVKAPELNNPQQLPITWSSNNEQVAVVDAASGAITITGTGTAVISATFAGSDDYQAKTASFTLVVSKGSSFVAFETGTVTATLGEDFVPPALVTDPEGLAVVYSSSNTRVATVDAKTGEVTLKGTGTTRITATFSGDANYESDYHYYDLTVVARLDPIVKEVDYELHGSDFLNPDGSDKDLSNVIINDILFTLKDTYSETGDGYDSNEGSIVINTVTSPSVLDDLLNRGVMPGSDEFASKFTGLTFSVPAGEGWIIIDSQEANGYRLYVKVGDNAPISIYQTERGAYNIPYSSSVPTLVYVWNGGTEVVAASRHRGKKAVGNVKVFSVSFKAAAHNGIETIGDDDRQDAKWYDLNGREIEKPLKKGLYIRDKRKVVIR